MLNLVHCGVFSPGLTTTGESYRVFCANNTTTLLKDRRVSPVFPVDGERKQIVYAKSSPVNHNSPLES